MNKVKILFLIYSLIFFSCSQYKAPLNEDRRQNEHFVLATLWMETAAECKALQIQAYNTAQFRIEQYIINNKLAGNEAVILDIDETVLETSLYQTRMIVNEFTWPTGWEDFINEATCKPIAGSLDFLNFIDSIGFNIFYVSNRHENERESLTANLKKYDFPQVKNSNILLKSNSSSKEERREFISSTNKIVLLIGDNLGDFSSHLNKGDYIERTYSVFEMSSYFGDKFIILPNPTYGDWEGSLNPDYWNVPADERDKIRKDILKKLLIDQAASESNK